MPWRDLKVNILFQNGRYFSALAYIFGLKSCGMHPGDFWIPTNSATFRIYVHMQQALKLSYSGCACAYLQIAQNVFGFLMLHVYVFNQKCKWTQAYNPT